MINLFFSLFRTSLFVSAFHTLWSLIWIWLPIVLGSIFLDFWIRAKRAEYINTQGQVLLELKLPKEVSKSPEAMELIIGSLSQPGVGSLIDVYLKGKIRPWFSLEIVSIGGQVKFFIWSQKNFRNMIESQIYAQFPTVEVHEVPDYALQTTYDPETMNLWGTQFKLSKADAYPLKTYIDYGLDKNPDEEFKIDPMTPLVEFMGSLKPAENMWIQILVQAHKKEGLKDLRVFEKPDWKKEVEVEMKKIIEEQALIKAEEGKTASLAGLTDVQKDVIKSMQRNLGKTALETMVRGVYFAPKDIFNPGNIGGLAGGFRQYGSGLSNSFQPGFTIGYEYPWQDFRGRKAARDKVHLFDAYRKRSFFHAPYRHFHGSKPFILTTEELATLFHFPGSVLSTPTLDRTMSKKSEAPANLPI